MENLKNVEQNHHERKSIPNFLTAQIKNFLPERKSPIRYAPSQVISN